LVPGRCRQLFGLRDEGRSTREVAHPRACQAQRGERCGNSASAPASRMSWTFRAEIASMPSGSHTAPLAAVAAQPHRRTSSTGILMIIVAARCKVEVAAERPSVVSRARPSSSRSRGRGSPGGRGRARTAQQISGSRVGVDRPPVEPVRRPCAVARVRRPSPGLRNRV
jgi:hypothetical protein